MSALAAAAAGCVLQLAETRLTADEQGWTEQTELQWVADPTCAWVEVALPPGASWISRSARDRLSDGGRIRHGEERWEDAPFDPAGGSSARLHLPELVGGDRVQVSVERRWRPGPLALSWGPANYVSVEVVGGTVAASGPTSGDDHHRWSSGVGPELEWIATGAGHPAAAPRPERPLPAVGTTHERRLTLKIPAGDPQVKLYPGGGSEVRIDDHWVFAPANEPRVWPLDLPPGAAVDLRVEPSGTATLEQGASSSRLRIAPSEAPVRVDLGWVQPDAPTFGERGADLDALTVDAPGGAVAWADGRWWLVGYADRPVLPTREVLVEALDHRFRGASLPEPGAPMTLRGRAPSWELAADLRPALLERSRPATWPADPLWPRKLVKARRTGALTRTEAALTMWLYARQLRLDAQWALARPASAGPGPGASAAGYRAALVRITLDGESRWIDPTCDVCGPFELPPDLEGADVLSRGADRTPDPTEGRVVVVVTPDRAEWTLEGPPALLLRLFLQGVAPDQRSTALARRLGGPGARLIALEGLELAGQPIRVTVSGPPTDPLALPTPRDDGTGWSDWLGDRVLVTPPVMLPDASVEGETLSWRRVTADGHTTETLSVRDRTVPADEIRAVDGARRPPVSPPEPVPSPP